MRESQAVMQTRAAAVEDSALSSGGEMRVEDEGGGLKGRGWGFRIETKKKQRQHVNDLGAMREGCVRGVRQDEGRGARGVMREGEG